MENLRNNLGLQSLYWNLKVSEQLDMTLDCVINCSMTPYVVNILLKLAWDTTSLKHDLWLYVSKMLLVSSDALALIEPEPMPTCVMFFVDLPWNLRPLIQTLCSLYIVLSLPSQSKSKLISSVCEWSLLVFFIVCCLEAELSTYVPVVVEHTHWSLQFTYLQLMVLLLELYWST